MAHGKSAKKRIRQSAVRRLRNRQAKSVLRTSVKKFAGAARSGDAQAALEAFRVVQKKLDRTASKGIIRAGAADRIKSRLAARLKAVKPAPK